MSSQEVSTANPLAVPYQTGAYLISDAGPDNFRDAMTLTENPYRASGSHQLGIADFVRVLDPVVSTYAPSVLYLVDLREETHGYFNGAPVSWYADNDFGNVGQSKEWILRQEEALLHVHKGQSTSVFTIEDDANDDLQQERVLPVSFTRMLVGSVRTEKEVAAILSDVFKPIAVEYVRIPVTDHCAPSEQALGSLVSVFATASQNSWVHFHCHGGDGRTSTFLALYDILCQKKAGGTLPTLEEFAARQCELFSYCLDPAGCAGGCGKATTGWKLSLAEARWAAMGAFLSSPGRWPRTA